MQPQIQQSAGNVVSVNNHGETKESVTHSYQWDVVVLM